MSLSSSVVALPSSSAASGEGSFAITRVLRRLLPLWGMLIAASLIISRRPDAVLNAQFWAEDGKLFYADVYNHGLLATLLVPQSGYFQELQTLSAGVAQLVSLASAPLMMNCIAIAVRVLPVGLLLSTRAESISRDVRVRALLAGLYIALPGVPEADGNVDNALWYLAVAALIVLMSHPPARRITYLGDLAIIGMCAVTGVFSIALAPLAFLYRRWRGAAAVPNVTLAILTVGAMIQLLAIFVLEYHLPSGFSAAPRDTYPLHATILGFFEIFGARVVADSVFGNSITFGSAAAILMGIMGVAGMVVAWREGSAELRLMVLFGFALFVMAVAHPLATGWPELAQFPDSGRYFIIPQFAIAAILACVVVRKRRGILAAIVVPLCIYMCAVTIPREWRYESLEQTTLPLQASLFAHVRRGDRMTFVLQPAGWSMTLVKH